MGFFWGVLWFIGFCLVIFLLGFNEWIGVFCCEGLLWVFGVLCIWGFFWEIRLFWEEGVFWGVKLLWVVFWFVGEFCVGLVFFFLVGMFCVIGVFCWIRVFLLGEVVWERVMFVVLVVLVLVFLLIVLLWIEIVLFWIVMVLLWVCFCMFVGDGVFIVFLFIGEGFLGVFMCIFGEFEGVGVLGVLVCVGFLILVVGEVFSKLVLFLDVIGYGVFIWILGVFVLGFELFKLLGDLWLIVFGFCMLIVFIVCLVRLVFEIVEIGDWVVEEVVDFWVWVIVGYVWDCWVVGEL